MNTCIYMHIFFTFNHIHYLNQLFITLITTLLLYHQLVPNTTDTSTSTAATTTATANHTSTHTAVGSISSLKGKQLGSVLIKWQSELQLHTREFHSLAQKIIQWDLLLLENGHHVWILFLILIYLFPLCFNQHNDTLNNVTWNNDTFNYLYAFLI